MPGRPAPRAVDPRRFRDGMAQVAAAVHVVTVRDGASVAGVTATSVCSLSDGPSSLLVCLHRQGRVRTLLRPGLPLTVNTLRGGQDHIADRFAGRGALPMHERFQGGDWRQADDDAPYLADGLASFFCRVSEIAEAETHSIVIGHVTGLRLNPADDALVYGARRYRSLDLTTTGSAA